MRILLILNGPDGWQTGIEDGFNNLKSTGKISDILYFYFESGISKLGASATWTMVRTIADQFLPDFIALFHVSKVPVDINLIPALKALPSKPIIVYDEHDMYGGWSKPITATMKQVIPQVDVVSICGLGRFREQVSRLNPNIVYTPHHADIARFDAAPYILTERTHKIVLIGNKIKPRYLSAIRRLPGARGRDDFVRTMGTAFPRDFTVYGAGWEGFKGNCGPVAFQQQMEVNRDAWITVAYEHYPDIPYYFSNRLPIALLAGSLYVCHYHQGYDEIFSDCDFIFFFKKNSEAIDIIHYIFSLSQDELLTRSRRAREFALRTFHPKVVWNRFLCNVLKAGC